MIIDSTLDITRVHDKGIKNTLYGDGEPVGAWGGTVWWLDLGYGLGLKVYTNQRCATLERGDAELAKRVKFWEKLVTIISCHLPVVYNWGLFRHTGIYERGATQFTQRGNDLETYYPVCLMKKYTTDLTKLPTPQEAGSISEHFKENRLTLSEDSFNGGQIGYPELVLLDITDKKGVKWF